jgi:DNA uptake protein ComE-like DNA-binding protein
MADGGSMGYTHKGTQWEYMQSWYLLALFSPWTFWFPLVYTGLRTLQFRWIIWGLFYGLPVFIKFFFDPADFGVEEFFKKWIFAALVVAAIHTFRARGEFLVRLASDAESHDLLMEGARLIKEGAQQAATDFVEEHLPQRPQQQRQAEEPRQVSTPVPGRPPRRLFDVNRIGERELAMLPGMGPERARQAIAMRESLGAFHSYDHFAEKLGLAVDAIARLRPLFIQPEADSKSNPEYVEAPDGRRILEINLASAQAIATLPGMDFDLARRAVALRETDGPYRSIEDFRYRLGLSPEVMIQISPIVSTVKTPPLATKGVKASGRVIDSSNAIQPDSGLAVKPSGRIVDL